MQDHSAEIDQSDPSQARKESIASIKIEREQALSSNFVKKLRMATPVTMVADINTPNLAPNAVVATVGGAPITAGAVGERLKPILYDVRMETYEAAIDALDQHITDLLLLAEATRRNVPPEDIVRTEVTSKIHLPTDAEIAKFYDENKGRINGELSAVKVQLSNYLQEQESQKLAAAMAERLRKGANIKMVLTEPEPPRQSISTDDDPSKGDASAPVTIVEFTDFQCPSCAAMQPILEEALKTYGKSVRFVVRDFPLKQHANAAKAAEAANAANAQGKFFEYSALLFQRQKALDVPSLKKYASELGLDRAKFDAALDRGVYAAEVRHDISDGEVYGVSSTPSIFINGVLLRTLNAEALKQAIDRELAAAAKKSP
jgi:protein-disulfide isomerase